MPHQEETPCVRPTDSLVTENLVREYLGKSYSIEELEVMFADIDASKHEVFDRIRREEAVIFVALLRLSPHHSCRVSMIQSALQTQKLEHEAQLAVNAVLAQ